MPDREESKSKSPRASISQSLGEAGPYLTLGLELGFTMIAWSAIGYLLDRWLGTLPWLTLAGVLVGMVSLFIQLTRAAKRSTPGSQKTANEKASVERKKETGDERF